MKTPSLIAADRARSDGWPCRRHPDRLDRRGADGAPPCRDSDRGMGRRSGRHHAARVCARLSGAQLPDPALRALHRQRGQSLLAAGLSRWPARAVPRGRRPPRPPDREARVAAAGPWRARPDRPALRHRVGGRGDGPLAPDRPQDRIGRRRSPRRREPRGFGQSRRDAGLHGRRQAHPRLLGRRRHRALLPCRTVGEEPAPARPLSAGGRMEGRRRHPGPGADQPHQPGAAAAVPADRDEREGREALPLDHRPPARHARAPSPRASARPAARACSAPKTIWRATTPATRCASSMSCWSWARSRVARWARSRMRPG